MARGSGRHHNKRVRLPEEHAERIARIGCAHESLADQKHIEIFREIFVASGGSAMLSRSNATFSPASRRGPSSTTFPSTLSCWA